MSARAGLRPEDLPDLLGIPLSGEQLAAATAQPGPGLIVAGAGSGKTTVMAARVVWLVGSGAVSSAGVLGLTFTNKAAAELLQRIRAGLRRLGPPAAATADDAVVGTYHAFAGALLREFGLLIGVEPSAELMSPVRQRQIAYRTAVRSAVDPEHAGAPAEVAAAIVALDALLSDNDVALEDVRAFDEELIAALRSRSQQRTGERMLATAAARRQLADLVSAYREEKRQRELLDFADYVRLGAQAARRHPQIGAMLRQRHQVVLLDEYQDTSVAQRAMLQALFAGGHPVTAVGDPCQAIYGWRGASPANMDGFPQHFPQSDGSDAACYPLATNRRSGSAVLDLANAVAAPLRSVHRAVAPLQPDPRNATGSVVCALLPTVSQELDWMVQQVRGSARPWQDIAVLARTNGAAGEAVAALRAADIPVQVHGKQALLGLPEVRWLVWALRLAADPAANDALAGLLMGPPWRIGRRDMVALARRAADLAPAGAEPRAGGPANGPADQLLADLSSDPLDGACLLDALFDPGPVGRYGYSQAAAERFARAAELLRSWQRRAGGAVADLVRAIAVESGLAAELGLGRAGGAPGQPPDDAGLVALADLARRFDDADGGRTLSDFLAWLQVAETIPDGPEAPPPAPADAVTVMTVHASKGLEFPVVVLPGLVEGAFPSDRGRGTWPTTPGAIPAPLLQEPQSAAIAAFPPDPTQPRASQLTAFAAACRAAERLEETRLAYVAVTRARERLIMSGHRWGRTQRRPRRPSEYLLAAGDAASGAARREGQEPSIEVDIWALPPDEDAENPMLQAAAAGRGPVQAPSPVPWDLLAQRMGAIDPMAPEPLDGQVRAAAAGWDRELAAARAELAAARAGRQVRAPADLSVSGWLAMARDPDGFALDLARPVPAPVSATAAAGDEFHAWVAARSGQLALWDLDELIDADEQDPGAAAGLRGAFAQSPFGALAPIAVEHPVALAIGGRVVRGRIDAVYRIDGSDWVVDWKTGAGGRADPLQLAVYRSAWAAERGAQLRDVVGCFVFVGQRRYEVYRDLPGPRALAAAIEAGHSAALRPTSQHRWDG